MARVLGFCSRTGSAVAVAVDVGGRAPVLAGRWTVELIDPATPGQLYHAAAALPADQAERLVRGGVAAVTEVATLRLRELRSSADPVAAIAVVTGDHPVPDSLARILASHPLMHAAEGQLYRDALLEAAAACGLPAHGLPKSLAAARLTGDLSAVVAALGSRAGPPWRKDHKLATVAALVTPG